VPLGGAAAQALSVAHLHPPLPRLRFDFYGHWTGGLLGWTPVRRAPLLWPIWVMLTFSPARALAQLLPPLDIHARYEEELIADVLAREGLVAEPSPWGKTIERIVISTNDVFLPHFDPVPVFFNHFHATTRPYIIRQELLFHDGDVIGPDTLPESERNLRDFFILAVARIVTARGSTPDRVVVVVVTKDLWTLRPNTNFETENGTLDLLSFTLAEHNLFGRNKFFGINFRLDPATVWLGEHYTDPRVLGTRLTADEQFLTILNRSSGDAEGAIVRLSLGRPLYSLATKWAWNSSFQYVKSIERRFQGGETIPAYTYDQRFVEAVLDGQRSFGLRWKSIFTAGYRLDSSKNDPEATTDPANVPLSEDDSQLFWRYDFYEATYRTFQNVQTFALTEDFRFGPQSFFEIDWAPEELGSSTSFARLSGQMAWRWLLGGDDILWASLLGDVRYAPSFTGSHNCSDANSQTSWVNRVLQADVINVSPRLFKWVRVHSRASLHLRDCDLSNALLQLGATTGLRGFPSGAFSGHNQVLANVELRSKPIALFTMYVGAVAFWDGGRVWFSHQGEPDDDLYLGVCCRTAGFHQDVGIGLRVLFPQFNHLVVRFDLAFPLDHPPDEPSLPPVLTAAFDQFF
jgi:hypothetical protein